MYIEKLKGENIFWILTSVDLNKLYKVVIEGEIDRCDFLVIRYFDMIYIAHEALYLIIISKQNKIKIIKVI